MFGINVNDYSGYMAVAPVTDDNYINPEVFERVVSEDTLNSSEDSSNEEVREKVEKTKAECWNEDFQNILSLEDGYEKFKLLSNLAKDFTHSAKIYGIFIHHNRK